MRNTAYSLRDVMNPMRDVMNHVSTLGKIPIIATYK